MTKRRTPNPTGQIIHVPRMGTCIVTRWRNGWPCVKRTSDPAHFGDVAIQDQAVREAALAPPPSEEEIFARF